MEKMINVNELFYDELFSIWNKYVDIDEELISRKFLAPEFIKKDALLFLGINPSYDPQKPYERNFYEVNENDPGHPYFSKFKELTNEVNDLDWTHLDLLFFRETNQKIVDKFIYNNSKGLHFIFDQIMLSKKLIELSKPRIIIASNTKVRQLLGFDKVVEKNEDVWMGYDFCFDDSIGTYRITTPGELFNTPIFFTSMLSGQRALDKGSFRRLQWHIKYVLKNKQ